MLFKGDRVKHRNPEINAQYGVMEIWEIKNDTAFCRYGDFSNMGVIDFPIADLIKADS